MNKTKTVLTVDIGNTTVAMALMSGLRVQARAVFATALSGKKLAAGCGAFLESLGPKAGRGRAAFICSVVPRKTREVEKVLRSWLSCPVAVVGRDVIVPIKNRYRRPEQVGQDRLVCAFAAGRLYGAPAIVVDLGTAITLDVVSSREEYLGGIIVPGIGLSADSLWQRTALLPKIEIKKPARIIGQDTDASIRSGLFYGYGEMISGLIRQLKKTTGKKPVVVMTGGYVDWMKAYVAREVPRVDKDLVMKGLALMGTGNY